ncbi:hypothetical protein KI387_030787 [Taxus chinensis]|uniref:RNA-polymerase II-associated protein 3-like C-terminal domain-containing protein n=1 Tax=Taxus chinensis TaxID=29808 RepID=A0AA38CEJ1_TAXCH|nr:hypothetical protein KI387_030787 [Taxus chinensis]
METWGKRWGNVNLPPVRGRVQKSSQSSVRSVLGVNKREEKSHEDGHIGKSSAASHTHDNFHNKWDKFDVDAALKDVDEREEGAPPRKVAATEIKTSKKVAQVGNLMNRNYGDGNSGTINRLSSVFNSNDSATDATSEKEQGNEYFKAKKYPQAIDCYSRSIILYPSAVTFANRAMAYIKLRRFEEAEYDCTEAIKFGTIDFEFALRLEPENKELKKQYLESRALYEKKISKMLPEEKVPFVIQEVTSTSIENTSEKTRIEADQETKASITQIDSAARSDLTLAKDSLKIEVDSRKLESHVKQKSLNGNQKQDSQFSAQAVAARAASRAMAAVAQNITAPKTAYEFEAMWKGFSEDRYAQSELLKVMAPSSLQKVFKDALSAPLLMDIIRCVECFFMEKLDFSIQFLENLTKVGRFDMTIMCLSSKDRAALRQIWDEVFTSKRVPVDFQEELNRLRKKYCR